MQKRTIFLTLAVAAGLVAMAGCSGANANDNTPPGTKVSGSSRRALATGTVLDLRSNVRISSASSSPRGMTGMRRRRASTRKQEHEDGFTHASTLRASTIPTRPRPS